MRGCVGDRMYCKRVCVGLCVCVCVVRGPTHYLHIELMVAKHRVITIVISNIVVVVTAVIGLIALCRLLIVVVAVVAVVAVVVVAAGIVL